MLRCCSFAGGVKSPAYMFLLLILLTFLGKILIFYLEVPHDDSCGDETVNISFAISVILWFVSFGLFPVEGTSWTGGLTFVLILIQCWSLDASCSTWPEMSFAGYPYSHCFLAELASSLRMVLGSYVDLFLPQVQMRQPWSPFWSFWS